MSFQYIILAIIVSVSASFPINKTFYFDEKNIGPIELNFSRGVYYVELFGASGGCTLGGKGGRAMGKLYLKNKKTLYLYIGGQGKTGSSSSSGCLAGGWNGGGQSCSKKWQCSGAGGTDIRLSRNDKYEDRIIVAGGGGGAAGSTITDTKYPGGYGGGTSGGDVLGSSGDINIAYGKLYAKGGNQEEAGNAVIRKRTYTNENGKFGVGGKGAGGYWYSGGGGGGYYGGAGGYDVTGGGGGSGYYNKNYIINGKLIPGNIDGNSGNGKITISYIGSGLTKNQNPYNSNYLYRCMKMFFKM